LRWFKLKKARLISYLTLAVAIIMMSVGILVQNDYSKLLDYNMADMTASALYAIDNKVEDKKEDSEISNDINMDVAEAAYIKVEKAFNEMSLEEAISALNDGTLGMEYSAVYSYNGLTKQRGAIFYNGHRETYYSEKVLPGNGLNIPGRHVADDGTIRDADGYICVAADPSYMAKGSVLITSLGPAKVYDSGCAYGTIDIYVNW